jgi:hypothetical protein
MKRNIIAIIALLLLPGLAAIAQISPLTKYLPDNTDMVMSFNPVRLAQKIPGETFRQSSLYLEMMKNDDGEMRAFMSDPSISGIDFNYDLLLATMNDSTAEEGKIVSIMGVLKNEALFSLLVNKLNKSDEKVQEFGSNKLFTAKMGGPAIAWNNEMFVLAMANKTGMKNDMSSLYMDTTDSRDFEERMKEVTEKYATEQRKICLDLLTIKPANTLATNSYYTKVMTTPGDIKLWNYGSGVKESLGKVPGPMKGMFGSMKMLAPTHKTAIINFEKGKISGSNQNFITDEMAAIYKKYPATPLNTELVQLLPEANILGMFMTSMDGAMAKEIMQQSGIHKLIDSLKSEIPFDISQLGSAFKTNILVALLNMPSTTTESPDDDGYSKRKNLFKGLEIVVAIPIADKNKFDVLRKNVLQMVDSLKKSKGEEDEDSKANDFMPSVKHNDNLCVITMSDELSNSILNNKTSGPVPAWLQEYSSYPMVMNLNMKEMMRMIFMGMKGSRSEEDGQMKKMFDRFDKVIVTGGNYENGSLNSKMEFRFTNPNEDALKQLFDLINEAAENAEKVREQAILNGQKKTYLDEGVKVDMAPSDEIKIVEVKQDEEVEMPPPPPPPKKPVKRKK